jgi:repressor of nif and glnA expression
MIRIHEEVMEKGEGEIIENVRQLRKESTEELEKEQKQRDAGEMERDFREKEKLTQSKITCLI